ncbi:hypothetical protein PENTCL1PPCAC_11937, partial [Pristionchus entomophagus]
MTITDVDRHTIWSGIVVFNIFGLFGNLNVISLIALRTKYGNLLTILISSQSICLLYELVGLVYGISGVLIIRKTCFYLISPYIFTYCVQMALMAAISTDLLLSIAFPLRHRAVRTTVYLTMLIIPAFIYGITVIFMGVFYMDETEIKLCQPPLNLPFTVRRVWYFIGLVFNAITVLAYIVAFAIIYCKCRKLYYKFQFDNSDIERKAMKSLTVLILVFIFSRFISTFFANFLNFDGYPKEVIERAQAYMVFPAMTCYSSTFYVCLLRSSEYRKIFWSQIVGIVGTCGEYFSINQFIETELDNLRRTCFYILSPYIFTNCFQMALMAAISTDLMISITFPLRHRMVRRRSYLSLLVLPGFIYGIVSLCLGFV